MGTGPEEAPRAGQGADEDGALATVVGAPDFGAFAADETGSELPPEAVLVVGPGILFAGRYRIRHRIARGGMSTVWDAVDERIDRAVALKLMSTHLADDPEYCARFEQEAKAAARLASPNVVALYDYGLHQGLPFMVLERLVGEDLHARTRREGALSIEATIRIVEQTASALHAAHRAGIVHRDIKPHNLFLADQDGEEVVKLLDFGVAKHAGTAALRTKTGLMVGSPYFMSPEQVRGAREVDARSDLFSLGAVAYLCLTGRTPFTGAMPAVFLAILEGRPPAVTTLRSGLPPAIDAFFARALATEPGDRFATATELAAALRRALEGGALEGGAGQGGAGQGGAVVRQAPGAASTIALRPAPAAARGRPRVVVLDDEDEPQRPSSFPTAISEVPAEILRNEVAPTVMPPAPGAPVKATAADPSLVDRSPTVRQGHGAAVPPVEATVSERVPGATTAPGLGFGPPRDVAADPDLPPVLGAPMATAPFAAVASPAARRDDPVLAAAPTPRLVRPAPLPPPPPQERTVIVDEAVLAPTSHRDPTGGPGFSIAMRSYQPSVWAAPPRPPRSAPRQRLRAAVPLVLASMAGFILAVALLVIVWAALG